MADPKAPPPLAVTRKKRTGLWIGLTIVLLGGLHFGPSIAIVLDRGIAGSFDWVGFTAYQLGRMVVPLVIGCLGLLIRRRPGPGFFATTMAAYLVMTIGSLAP